MKKDFGKNPWFYPLPVLIVGTYDNNEIGRAHVLNSSHKHRSRMPSSA